MHVYEWEHECVLTYVYYAPLNTGLSAYSTYCVAKANKGASLDPFYNLNGSL